MPANVYAARYARVLFRTARESRDINTWQTELTRLADLLQDKPLFKQLSRLDLGLGEKANLLKERLGEINPVLNKLTTRLAARNNLELVQGIADEFHKLADNFRGVEGVQIAEAITAIELDDESRLRLASKITNIMGQPVVLRCKVDAAIIGGVIIKIGDKLIDGSVHSRLEELRKKLVVAGRKV